MTGKGKQTNVQWRRSKACYPCSLFAGDCSSGTLLFFAGALAASTANHVKGRHHDSSANAYTSFGKSFFSVLEGTLSSSFLALPSRDQWQDRGHEQAILQPHLCLAAIMRARRAV